MTIPTVKVNVVISFGASRLPGPFGERLSLDCSPICYPMTTLLQRRNEILASNLLFGSWAFSLMAEIVRTKVLHVAKMSPLLAVVVVYSAYLGLYYAVRQGKRWAKVTLAVVFVLTILVGVVQQIAGYSLLAAAHAQDYLYLVTFAFSYAIPAWALGLIFKKNQSQPAV